MVAVVSVTPILFLLATAITSTTGQTTEETLLAGSPLPAFTGPVNKVVVTEGQDASFVCRVTHLGKHQVVWIKLDTEQVLTYHLHVIIADQRFQIQTRADNEWLLKIRNVTRKDRGIYMCQINTDPPAVSYGELDIVKAPEFLDNATSPSNVEVDEHQNVTLRCGAAGNPRPNITWQRGDGRMLPVEGNVYIHKGSEIALHSVTRHDVGIFVCMASNGIVPSKRREINLRVKYAPVVSVGADRVPAHLGMKVAITCMTRAYPYANIEWYFHQEHLNVETYHHHITNKYQGSDIQESVLTIFSVNRTDFGIYYCKAFNVVTSRKKSESVVLYEPIPGSREDMISKGSGTESNKKFSKHHRRKQPGKANLSLEDDPSAQSRSSAQDPSGDVRGQGHRSSSSSSSSHQISPVFHHLVYFALFQLLLRLL